MQHERRSYSKLSNLPVYYLYGTEEKLIATVRANDINEASRLFQTSKLKGVRVSNKYVAKRETRKDI